MAANSNPTTGRPPAHTFLLKMAGHPEQFCDRPLQFPAFVTAALRVLSEMHIPEQGLKAASDVFGNVLAMWGPQGNKDPEVLAALKPACNALDIELEIPEIPADEVLPPLGEVVLTALADPESISVPDGADNLLGGWPLAGSAAVFLNIARLPQALREQLAAICTKANEKQDDDADVGPCLRALNEKEGLGLTFEADTAA
jgi:hypothetical protein